MTRKQQPHLSSQISFPITILATGRCVASRLWGRGFRRRPRGFGPDSGKGKVYLLEEEMWRCGAKGLKNGQPACLTVTWRLARAWNERLMRGWIHESRLFRLEPSWCASPAWMCLASSQANPRVPSPIACYNKTGVA